MNGMQAFTNGDAAWHREQNGVETFESALLKVRKALCGNIHNQDDIVEMAAKLTKQRDELLKALSDLLAVCPAEVECSNMHHPKSKRHRHDQPCPVVREYQAAVVEADRVVASVKEKS